MERGESTCIPTVGWAPRWFVSPAALSLSPPLSPSVFNPVVFCRESRRNLAASCRDRRRKPAEYYGKVAWEAYLTRFVMAKTKGCDEREKLDGRQRVNSGDGVRGVVPSLSSTLDPSCCSPHPLAPLSSPRPRLVVSSRWKTAGLP